MEAKAGEAPPPPATAAAAPPAETLPDAPRRRAGPPKRKAAPNFSSSTSASFPPPKRLSKERNALHPLPPTTLIHNGPVTRARQSPHKLSAIAVVQNPLPPPAPAESLAPPAVDPVQADGVKPVPVGEPFFVAEFEAVRSRGSNVHAVPTPTGWFSWKRIHQIEKHTMPSFFNGKSGNRTPDIYMDIRNSIMKKFHSDPQMPVEVKDLSELSVGDLNARQEVLEFLDHWGLINFHPFPPHEPAASNPDTDGVSRTSSLIEKLYQFETVTPSPVIGPKKLLLPAPAVRPPSFLSESAIAGDPLRPAGPSVEYHCNSCSADCSRRRYHCQKQADFDLCTECYNAGKFGSGMSAADFILMEPADVPGVSSGSWTDQETLLLLEALELFGENWNEIAEHVATKTKDQCMLHFIQMPIEDPFLDRQDEDNVNIQENTDPTLAKKESESSDVPTSAKKESESSNVPTSAKKESESSIVPTLAKMESESSDVLETKKTKSAGDLDEPISSPADDSNMKVSGENEDSCKTGASIVLDILQAAFQAVDYLPEQGGILSFTEAGNPVMALAAFLAGLVEPDVASTSTRSSLKAMSEDSPGLQLATRHCFLLEDPPNDRKDPPEPESMDSGQPHKEEDQMLMSNGTDESKDCVDQNEKNDVQVEKETEPSKSSQDFSQKPPAENELGESAPLLEATHRSTEDSGGQSSAEEQVIPMVKDVNVSDLPTMITPRNTKELGDLALQREDTESTAEETNDLEMAVEEKPNFLKEVEDTSNAADVRLTSATVEGQESQQQTNSLKEVEDSSNAAGTRPVEGQESQQQTTVTDSTVKSEEKAGDDDKKPSLNDDGDDKKISLNDDGYDKKISLNDDDENCNPMETDGDHDINKIKRAAVTALSAAAMKAKLLADQEEDQIMQLVSLAIEKQLHKLETKLALFTEMESVIMRVREQIDRARQRLLHERAQIVAARLGVSTSSVPVSKIALGYGSSTILRPPSMSSLKPPPMPMPMPMPTPMRRP